MDEEGKVSSGWVDVLLGLGEKGGLGRLRCGGGDDDDDDDDYGRRLRCGGGDHHHHHGCAGSHYDDETDGEHRLLPPRAYFIPRRPGRSQEECDQGLEIELIYMCRYFQITKTKYPCPCKDR